MAKPLKTTIVVIIALAIVSFLGYSLYITFETGANKGLVSACPAGQEGKCWFGHIHAYVPISICGADYRLPIELADLSGPHTHEEKNMIHWHGDKGLPYDSVTGQITDLKPLTLSTFFELMKVPFDETHIADKKNGDACPDGTIGSIKMFINGVASDVTPEYVWKDHDVIFISFDNRSSEIIEEELQNNPIPFPALGRG